MDKKRIEENLISAIEAIKPDQLDAIMRDARKLKAVSHADRQRKKGLTGRLLPILMAALLVICTLSYYGYSAANKVSAKVILDVNPSVELQINRAEKVLKATADDADGMAIIAGLDLKGSDIKSALNALIGSMVKQGYLSDLHNSILITVDSKDSQSAMQLSAELSKEVDSLTKGSAAILSQALVRDEMQQQLSEKHNISAGKAQLVQKIAESSPLYDAEDIADLSINDLNLINKNSREVSTSGSQASQKGYIGTEKAIEIALQHFGLSKSQVTDLEAELDYEFGRMVYEVEFEVADYDYECDVDAVTGAVIFSESENPADTSANPAGNDQKYITREKAKSIALKHAGVSDPVKLEIELEKENGKMIYDIEFKSSNYEYSYEIDAVSGSILKSHKEYDD